MNDNIWHLRSRMETDLNPIFEMFDERQHCLLGMKPRTNLSELQYDADKLDMALLLLCAILEKSCIVGFSSFAAIRRLSAKYAPLGLERPSALIALYLQTCRHAARIVLKGK